MSLMRYNREAFDTYAREIFSIPIGRGGKRLGLVFSADRAQWFFGIFTRLQ